MAWSWRYETEHGEALDGGSLPGELFSSRGDAESWLGENWRSLVEGGAARVTLVEDDRAVYSMSLDEPA
ncbi:hypothetical protein ACFPZ0_18530 [Streptomonospora nanhaiensis]|uniref:Uncharacterized protein n=1 Tax=Streptomonospora nanhaiensis TaxID=1323731 RepID=A0A853BKA8_9ACTN|nr:hypothetical protein [Streptomonospora nanhaiensis]MBV2362371.1 hypothetical protein [Streptomonospora nanhaiensis]MBX9390687.1 hypothetical protein [Streptomonospora nanhaiensis]NYI94972.1 hypothetical protein [Streptomonospora nanhaiensis]